MTGGNLLKVIALTFVALFLVIQLVPVDREPPMEEGLVSAPDEVLAVLRQNCFDCHSNRTRWPWYGYVAPFSWLIQDHVQEARGELDFTSWNQYDEDERLELREEIWDEVDLGEMPPDYYVLLHPEGRVSEAEQAILKAWAEEAYR